MTLSDYTAAVRDAMASVWFVTLGLAQDLVERYEGLVAENWEYGEPIENTGLMLLKREGLK